MPSDKSRILHALLWGGFTCGVLDITAAFVVYGLVYGVRPTPLLQGIASGLLGPRAFNGGTATAVLGLLCHFVIAFGAAAVYLAASRGLPFLVRHAVISGILYGPIVYFFMQCVVLPLSDYAHQPFSMRLMIIGVVIHIFCVGLPISLSISRFSR